MATVGMFSPSDCKRISAAVIRSERVAGPKQGGASGEGRNSTFWAKVTGHDSSTPARHSWKIVYLSQAGVWTDWSPAITGTSNLIEPNGATLANDTVTRVELCQNDADGNPVYLAVSSSPSPALIRVRVTAAASGGGKYSGYVVSLPTTALVAAGNLADSDLGANGGACLIVNAAEAGQSTHDLTSGTVRQKTFAAVYLSMSGDSTPLPVYQINGFDLPGCA